MTRIWQDRLAEVWAEPGKAGTGVVMGAGAVLTARHVVAGALQGGSVLARVVRPGALTADWVPMNVLAEDSRWDVALLGVRHGEGTADALAGSRWLIPSSSSPAVADLSPAGETGCETVGFPDSEVQRAGKSGSAPLVRQSEQLTCTLLPAGQAKPPVTPDRPLPRRWLPLNVDGPRPGAEAGWAGMSGAGVILPDGRLVAIVVSTVSDHQSGRFYVVPLADALADSSQMAGALAAALGRPMVAEARDAPLYRDVLNANCLGADGSPALVSDAGFQAFGVKRAGLPEEPDFLDYVPRDGDQELRESMQVAQADHRLLLVVGGSAGGKSRSAAEAARRLLGECRLLCPKQTALGRLRDLSLADIGSALVWLDDAERFDGRVFRDTVDWLRELGVVVVATIRRTALEARMPIGDIHDPLGDVLCDDDVVRVDWDVTWNEQELARVSEHVSYQPLLDWAAAGNSPSAWVVAGPALEKRLSLAKNDDERPVRYALVRTVLDWYRTGISAPCPKDTARALLQPGVEAGDDDVADAFEWALESVIGASRGTAQALLSEVVTGALAVHDYIQDADARSVASVIPDHVWHASLKLARTAGVLFSIGMSAALQDNNDIAAKAFLPLAKAGDIDGMTILGLLLMERDPRQARKWWKKAARTGYSAAMFKIRILLGPRNPAQARRLLQRAAKAGNTDAKYNLSILLEDTDPDEAARWRDEWENSGHDMIHTMLGMIMEAEVAEAVEKRRKPEK